MRLSQALFAIAALVCFQGLASGAGANGPKQYVVHVKVMESKPARDDQQTVQEVIATPSVVFLAGREVKVNVGDKASLGDGEWVPYGTQLTMRLDPADDGKIRIKGKCEVSTLLVDENSPKHVGTRGTSIYLNDTVELKKTLRVTLGGKSVELTVEEFSPDPTQSSSAYATDRATQ
jgi:hypothetical protein